ncbi:tyrosine-type recombinase/integrase [Flavobacterium columnare]|uniref:tyrosine-type recombinase/integrase n=1 Tax=Flavobacterium columnare TaxID=996 RepID=UPI004033F2B3
MTLEDYLKKNYGSYNYLSILYRITQYQKHIIEHKKADLKHILKFIKILRDLNKTPSNIATYLYAIKIYYNYLQLINIRKDHPCKSLKLKDKIDKKVKIDQLYTQQELENFLEKTPDQKKLMVSLFIYQAITVAELIDLKPSQINIQKAEIHLNNRVLPLLAQQIYLYLEHIQNKKIKEHDLLFTNLRGKPLKISKVNLYINQNRPKEQCITPTKLRQSLIKNLLLKNDLRVVQVFAGHKKSITTQQYRTSDFEELKNKINLLHPFQ